MLKVSFEGSNFGDMATVLQMLVGKREHDVQVERGREKATHSIFHSYNVFLNGLLGYKGDKVVKGVGMAHEVER